MSTRGRTVRVDVDRRRVVAGLVGWCLTVAGVTVLVGDLPRLEARAPWALALLVPGLVLFAALARLPRERRAAALQLTGALTVAAGALAALSRSRTTTVEERLTFLVALGALGAALLLAGRRDAREAAAP